MIRAGDGPEPTVPSEGSGRPAGSARSRRIRFLLRAAFSGALLWIVLGRVEMEQIGDAIASARLELVVAALALYPLAYVCSILRWRTLLAAREIRPGFAYLVRAYLSAVFVSNVLPSTVGGDVLRIYDSWRAGADRSGAVSVILMDRMLGLAALLSYAVLGVLVPGELVTRVPGVRWLVLGLAAAVAAVVLVAIAAPRSLREEGLPPGAPDAGDRIGGSSGRRGAGGPGGEDGGAVSFGLEKLVTRVRHELRRMSDAFSLYRTRPGALLTALGYSFLLQGLVIGHYVLAALALGLPVPVGQFLVMVPLVLVLMLLPVTINGIGLRETGFVGFLSVFGVSTGVGLSYAWVVYGIQLVQALATGLVFLTRRDELAALRERLRTADRPATGDAS